MDRFSDVSLESIKQIAKTPAKEIDRRRINLWFHRFLYYKFDSPVLSDYEYDKKELEYTILREHYTNVKIRFSCPLLCVGTDADKATESKIEQLINYWKKNKESKPKEDLKTGFNGQVLLFGTNFLREG